MRIVSEVARKQVDAPATRSYDIGYFEPKLHYGLPPAMQRLLAEIDAEVRLNVETGCSLHGLPLRVV